MNTGPEPLQLLLELAGLVAMALLVAHGANAALVWWRDRRVPAVARSVERLLAREYSERHRP
jgi:hypothetical protein